MNNENPYTTPASKLEISKNHSLPTAVYILGFLAVVFSLWYLGLDGRKWFLPLKDMGTFELIREWVTRVLYGVPKLGVVIGLVALFRFKKYAFRIYLVCWVFAIGHTIIFYGAYDLVPMTNIEIMRILVHHIIPHSFFVYMLITLSGKSAGNG